MGELEARVGIETLIGNLRSCAPLYAQGRAEGELINHEPPLILSIRVRNVIPLWV